MLRRFLMLLSLVLSSVAFAGVAHADTVTLSASEDAYIQQDNPDCNYDSGACANQQHLIADSQTTTATPPSQARVFVKFTDVPANATSVHLRMWVNGTTDLSPYAWLAPNTWSESTITYNNRPTPTGSQVNGTDPLNPAGAYYTWIVTGITPSAGGTVSFALFPRSTDGVDFLSSESIHPPQLDVTYTGTVSTKPVVTSLSPNHGPEAGGTTVTINGSHFTGTTNVWFGGYDATNVNVVSDSQVTAVSPYVPASTVNVSVNHAGVGVSDISAGSSYTYDSPIMACNDGVDNDSDGLTDYPADPGCTSGVDNDESNGTLVQCANNGDDDADGLFDLEDPGCGSATDTVESTQAPSNATVAATVESSESPLAGDTYDDPAIYHAPTAANSVILATIKGTTSTSTDGGLRVLNLDGTTKFTYLGFSPDNVDIRYNVLLGATKVDVAAVSNRTTGAMRFYTIDKTTGALTYVNEISASGGTPTGAAYGICSGVDHVDGTDHVFVTYKGGGVRDYKIVGTSGSFTATLLGNWDFTADATDVEGCVNDDELGTLYVGAEAHGIVRTPSRASDANYGVKTTMDATIPDGGTHLTPDVEGMTIYHTGHDNGYLIASSQGSNKFEVYDRKSHAWVKEFGIPAGSIDDVSDTDGIDVIESPLPGWSSGMFIAQDFANGGGTNQTFKMLPWSMISEKGTSTRLAQDPQYNPRLYRG